MMKRPKMWQIVAAAAVGAGGLTLMMLEQLSGASPWVRTLGIAATAMGMLAATGGVVLRLIKQRRAGRADVAFADTTAEQGRAVAHARAAVRRYVRAAKRSSFFARRALYERPWFLVVGERSAGKSALLERSGLAVPLRYPSEQDGIQPDEERGPTWYFGNDAVWIEAPGTYAGDGDGRRWSGLVEALAQVRRARPIDGMLVVVDVSKLCAATESAVKALGERLRARIDEMIAAGGIEFPVYLMLSHADEVPGFEPMFSPAIARNGSQVLGAAFDAAALTLLPGKAFVKEFGRLCEALADYRLLRLRRERDPNTKRLICRFLIEAEALQEKIAALSGELFKPSEYVGGPVFKGFYLTGCTESHQSDARDTTSGQVVSATVADHPLNPRRAKTGTATAKAEPDRGPRTHFALPALQDIARGGRRLVRKTQRAGRRALVRDIGINAAAAAVAFTIGAILLGARSDALSVYRDVHERIRGETQGSDGLTERYRLLDNVGQSVARLERIERRPFHTARLLGLYDGARLLERLERPYRSLLEGLIAAPAAACFEHEIERLAGVYGELDAERYDSLYLMLKSYLSIGETG
ncbi:MAG: hypothetical protein GF331_18240, partial [Chitinivibrionales bacterium]|nr:hypothetical protein [Chitinivibrionales bacterium]